MATSTRAPAIHTVDFPQGVSASVEGRMLSVKGPLGTVRKNFHNIHVNVGVDQGKIHITSFSGKKTDVVSSNTVSSIVRNMVTGVTEGYLYRMKVVFAHFPVTVKVKGDTVVVENFMGERSARVTKIVGDCKVSVDGDDIIIKGVSLEDVGQTSANLEQATKVKRKDQRIFLDGVYVYEKKKGW